MTLKRMLERAAAARLSIEERLDRLNGSQLGTDPAPRALDTIEDVVGGIVASDLSAAIDGLAAIEIPPQRRVVDGGVLTSRSIRGEPPRRDAEP